MLYRTLNMDHPSIPDYLNPSGSSTPTPLSEFYQWSSGNPGE
jgi:hypothetical protein